MAPMVTMAPAAAAAPPPAPAQMAPCARVPVHWVPHKDMASQRTKPTEVPGKDHKRPKGTEETKAKKDVSHSLPTPSPAQHHRDWPLAAHFIPFVAHYGNCQPNSFHFLFYQSTLSNSYSPFYTAQKATCGYRFHRDTDHTRKVIDVPSANTVKWRPIRGKKPQAKPINPKE